MINRELIRIKVVQMLYAYHISKAYKTVHAATKELNKSFEQSYHLYYALLQLASDLTWVAESEIETAKEKFLPTDEDLNPNMRFVHNAFVTKLQGSAAYREFIDQNNISWRDNPVLLNLLFDKVKHSEFYQNYMALEQTDLATDCNLWKLLYRKVLIEDDNLLEDLQARTVYCADDDMEIIGQFVVKTISKLQQNGELLLLPMFKDDEDKRFAEDLFETAIRQMDENNELIDKFNKQEKWDSSRVALMDRLIMCTAITEIKTFPEIPTTVSLNEYIELAKHYSTHQSAQFVNGILHTVIRELKGNGTIFKA